MAKNQRMIITGKICTTNKYSKIFILPSYHQNENAH